MIGSDSIRLKSIYYTLSFIITNPQKEKEGDGVTLRKFHCKFYLQSKHMLQHIQYVSLEKCRSHRLIEGECEKLHYKNLEERKCNSPTPDQKKNVIQHQEVSLSVQRSAPFQIARNYSTRLKTLRYLSNDVRKKLKSIDPLKFSESNSLLSAIVHAMQ